jgi:predicted metal-dependent enzyme (double-stranded beta helix superfamily)
VVQGAGAAIMTPTALSIISTTFTEGSERNKALGIWGALGGVEATTAWLIGGPLVDGPGWRWIFFINVPIGLAGLALSPVLLRESRAALTRRSYDPAGALTITGALVLLVYAVVKAPGAGWGDVRTILPLAGSALLLAAFMTRTTPLTVQPALHTVRRPVANPSHRFPPGRGPNTLTTLADAVRGVLAERRDWTETSAKVAEALSRHLPTTDDLSAQQQVSSPDGYRSQPLHVEPDGTFSIVALVWQPGQQTRIHDHVTWCAFGVIQGIEHEDLYDKQVKLIGEQANQIGDVRGFAPPGDIHRVRNSGTGIAISIHIYVTPHRLEPPLLLRLTLPAGAKPDRQHHATPSQPRRCVR